MDPQAGPGVREFADGIFLYTTRIPGDVGGGPMFVYEVESARADRRGVSFCIDFSGSTNLVLLPSATASTTLGTMTRTDVAGFADTNEGGRGGGSAGPEGNGEGGEKLEICGEVDSMHGVDETVATVGESHGATVSSGGASPLSARVSAEAFCRTILARVTVQDPEATGTIKISCSWEPLMLPSRGETEEVVRKHATSMQETLLAMRSLELAGDDESTELRAVTRSEEIAQRCRMHEVLYVDEGFPPTDTSLGDDLAGLAIWRRPCHFPGAFATNLPAHAAFGGRAGPLPSDVRPCPFAVDASLGCAMAALAERPRLVSAALCGRTEEVVVACSGGVGRGAGGAGAGARGLSGCGATHQERAFDSHRRGGGVRRGDMLHEWAKGTKKKRGKTPPKTAAAAAAAAAAVAAAQASVATRSGIFSARLCVDGVWKEYVLDDFFPCHAGMRGSGGGGGGGGGGPCLSRAHGPALWVSMLEKAYARAVGSYSTALGGCFISQLGGTPVESKNGGTGGQATATAAAKSGVVARPANVLASFTGAPFLQLKLGSGGRGGEPTTERKEEDRIEKAASDLWRSIVSWTQERWLVCLSTPAVGEGEDGAQPQLGSAWKNGLRLGYAYTVLDAADVGGGNRLVHLRGPLPAKEGWAGQWAEDSPRWTPEALSRLRSGSTSNYLSDESNHGPMPASLNGAFWVSIEEAAEYFVEAGVCMVRPTGGHKRRQGNGWAQEIRRRVSFARKGRAGWGVAVGATAGRGRKEEDVWVPSRVYALSVHATSRMFFSLYQEASRRRRGQRLRDAGISVLRLKGDGALQAVASSGNPAQASVCAGAVLTPGRYVVIPTCTGCITQEKRDGACSQGEGMEATRPRRTITEEEEKGVSRRRQGSQFPPDVLSALMLMFADLDVDCDGVLSREELDAFLRTSEGLPLQDDVHAWLVRGFSSCTRPRDPFGESWSQPSPDGTNASSDLCLTRRGFTDMYRYMWQAAGRDIEVVMRDLRFAGYAGSSLSPSSDAAEHFRAVITVHSDTRGFDFVAQPPDPDLLELALTLPVKRWGSIQSGPQTGGKLAGGDSGHCDVVGGISASNKCGTANNAKNSGATGEGDGDGSSRSEHDVALPLLKDKRRDAGAEAEGAPVSPAEDINSASKGRVSGGGGRLAPNTVDSGKGVNAATGKACLHVRPGPRGGEKAVTFVVESLVPTRGFAIKAVLDCAGSVNASALPGSKGLSREVLLLPGEVKMIQHLMPTDPCKPWSWNQSSLKIEAT